MYFVHNVLLVFDLAAVIFLYSQFKFYFSQIVYKNNQFMMFLVKV